MKYSKILLLPALAMLSVLSCNKMQATYKEFLVDRSYTGKPDSIRVRSGRNRVELTWLLLSDPKIASYKVLWNNGKDSVVNTVVKTDHVDTVRLMIENLREDIHFFDIYHYDKRGVPSVRATAVGHVYGERYEKSLLNRLVSFKRRGNDLHLDWTDADATMREVELLYTDADGNAVRHIVPAQRLTDTLLNFPQGGSFSYRTAYLPDSTALDTCYTKYSTLFSDLQVNSSQPLDMMLIYAGGSTRPAGWYKPEHFAPYVALTRDDGTFDWLYDGFLFLEIKDGDKSFFGTHGTVPANKADWTRYMEKFVAPGMNMSALDAEISSFKAKGGASTPFTKRKISIGIPEAKVGMKDWGEIDGKEMDFDKPEDRIAAYKWFIDLAIGRFQSQQYANLELVSFYWIQEGYDIDGTIREISDYLHAKKLYFYWIPHLLGADNVQNNWRGQGFDRAYLQPGYFYRTDKDYWRLGEASKRINYYQYLPYVEFDTRALKRKKNWGYRLASTIEMYELHDFWRQHPVGYYQGFDAWYQLSVSQDPEDRDLYLKLAGIIANRQKNR